MTKYERQYYWELIYNIIRLWTWNHGGLLCFMCSIMPLHFFAINTNTNSNISPAAILLSRRCYKIGSRGRRCQQRKKVYKRSCYRWIPSRCRLHLPSPIWKIGERQIPFSYWNYHYLLIAWSEKLWHL